MFASVKILISWLVVALLGSFVVISERRLERTKGKNLLYHAIFLASTVALLIFLPSEVEYHLFSPLGVIFVGTIYPIYESIRAVCTPQTADDTTWLQYWIAQGIVSYSTEWIDDVATRVPTVREHWYKFEFFYMLWLLLPYTDGATLMFDYITEPFLGPIVRPMAKAMEGWINSVVTTMINVTHLWIVWFLFVFLDPRLERFIVVGIGTVYPLSASLVAVTTPESADDTFWLTYWSCFGALFLIMEVLEAYLGNVPGFYSIVLFAIIYLMLPLFRGAEQVFRSILVPLAGLQELLLLRDAHLIKLDTIGKLPVERRKEILRTIANAFLEAHEECHDENVLKGDAYKRRSFKQGYQSIPQYEI